MRFPKPPIVDPMGEAFSAEDFESLAYNIDREMRYRPLQSQPLRVAEIGTWSGQSTLAIARPHVLVHCISSWSMPSELIDDGGQKRPERLWMVLRQGETNWVRGVHYRPEDVAFQSFVANTKGVVFRTVMPLLVAPHLACAWWPEQLDAVYINSDHDADELRQLVVAWKRHVRPGGNVYGLYKDHTVAGLHHLGGYNVDGTIWRHRVMKEAAGALGK